MMNLKDLVKRFREKFKSDFVPKNKPIFAILKIFVQFKKAKG